MKTFVTSLVALFLMIVSTFAQTDTVHTNLFKDIPAWMTEYRVPCVGVGIIENGQIKWVKNFGDLQAGHSAPENSLFNIASQTKPVTAMLTLKLVQMGKWNLDEPLVHYWTDPDIAGDPCLIKLTTRFVLSHQTGFPNWRSDNGGTKLKFKFEPGTASGYSGEGFEYLRRALEAKFHQSLAVLMATYLFKPLGMNDTQYWSENLDTTRFAMWHDGQGKRYATSIQTSVNAADDLITSIADYCTLGIYAMKLANDGGPVYAEMIRPQRRTKRGNASGLGWGLVDGLPNGEYALQHGGSDIGVRTMAIFLPGSKSGVVVMTNGDNGEFICDRIIKRALPEGALILETMNKSATSHERVAIADQLIQSYIGTYAQSNGKLVKVEKDGNALKISGDGVPTVTVFPESANKFFMEGYDVQLQFPDTNSLVVIESGKQVLKVNRK
ncbi:serine hydrolase domain-containing protein [Mucilaginibacter ginsenosidivorax]|uniref:Beta-lactamase family protein n=1 Tax=Mucilaginibacter ginsenosidivorax TaxID=862126 RepID=A0A5B8WD13_9SPHI|nr:serine hydrolase domain-containing protein [Mucilaginibacter ginsenosidivorax]QEC79828.1 beta-lactamase family protein [Mucilaginibacter ginsenosidivorax]